MDDRVALAGIAFVPKTGITWNELPAAVVGCSGVTCWRRVRDWTHAGVWPALHALLLAELRAARLLNLDRMAVDASHVHTLKGGHDVTRLLPLLDAVPPIRGLRGRLQRKPRELYADRGYDFDKYRRLLRKRGIRPRIAPHPGQRVLLRVEHHPHRPFTQLVGVLPRRHHLRRSFWA